MAGMRRPRGPDGRFVNKQAQNNVDSEANKNQPGKRKRAVNAEGNPSNAKKRKMTTTTGAGTTTAPAQNNNGGPQQQPNVTQGQQPRRILRPRGTDGRRAVTNLHTYVPDTYIPKVPSKVTRLAPSHYTSSAASEATTDDNDDGAEEMGFITPECDSDKVPRGPTMERLYADPMDQLQTPTRPSRRPALRAELESGFLRHFIAQGITDAEEQARRRAFSTHSLITRHEQEEAFEETYCEWVIPRMKLQNYPRPDKTGTKKRNSGDPWMSPGGM